MKNSFHKCCKVFSQKGLRRNLWMKLMLSGIFTLVLGSVYASNPTFKPVNKLQLKPGVRTSIAKTQCPDIILESFKIIGKVPVRGHGGSKLFRLRLQGIVKNQGNSGKGFMGEAHIFELPQGARRKQLARLRIQNLKPGKKMLVSALSEPLSVATEFLPQYNLLLKLNPRLSGACKKKTKHGPRFYQKLIQRRAVLKVLKH